MKKFLRKLFRVHYKYVKTDGSVVYLYKSQASLRGGKMVDIYYFRDNSRTGKGVPAYNLPEGKVPSENPRNGFVVLKPINEEHSCE